MMKAQYLESSVLWVLVGIRHLYGQTELPCSRDHQKSSCWCGYRCFVSILQLDGEALQGEELTATATLKNPLPSTLKKPEFIIEGPGLTSQLKIKLPQ
jgi:hypothetical protein